jgi:hypothetical protein
MIKYRISYIHEIEAEDDETLTDTLSSFADATIDDMKYVLRSEDFSVFKVEKITENKKG